MESRIVDIDDVKKVALALKNLRSKFAFVGGSIVNLYVNDPLADEVRETMDIDLSTSLNGYGAWARLQEDLSHLNFNLDRNSKITCRFLYDGIAVDIMPDNEKILGFSNPWYKTGLANMEQRELEDGLIINIFPVSYFIASKFVALNSRGRGDHRTSHDFTDVIYVVDNMTDIVDKILTSPKDVRIYLITEFKKLLNHDNRREIITCHLSRLLRDTRYPLIIQKIEKIVSSN